MPSGKNIEQWPKPDLLLIDGGKGQVSAAIKGLESRNVIMPLIGLAKRREQVIVPKIRVFSEVVFEPSQVVSENNDFWVLELGLDSHITKLLQRIRDESHRFAVSYHSTLKANKQTSSLLEEIPGIGPKTRKKLLKEFGSLRGLTQARYAEIEQLIGPAKTEVLWKYIRAEKRAQKRETG